MKRIGLLCLFIIFGGLMKAEAADWFQTWDRPEYREWAAVIPEGYLLHIIRKEKNDWLAVKAKLIMGEKGLPGFEVIDQKVSEDEQNAYSWIESWKTEDSLASVYK